MFITIDFGGTGAAIINALKTITQQLEKIMATQAEVAQQLRDVKTQLDKISLEENVLLQKISELQGVIDSGNFPVTAELAAAVKAVVDQSKILDDQVPDPPAPEPEPS